LVRGRVAPGPLPGPMGWNSHLPPHFSSARPALVIYTDAPGYVRGLLPIREGRGESLPAPETELPGSVLDAFFSEEPSVLDAPSEDPLWRVAIATDYARGSQYARLLDLARRKTLPNGLACVAGAGAGFQGFRGRSWEAVPGNVHLSVHLAPMREIERFETVFLALAAVSVVEVLDALPGLTGAASIKWVNDVLLEGAKVAGVLAYTQTLGRTVTGVVLGIGVNVEATPSVRPTAFVPAATSLSRVLSPELRPEAGTVLRRLLGALAANYRLLLAEGYGPLMQRYRERSAVLGEDVLLSSDDPDEVPRVFAAGRAVGIGDGLELLLAGHPAPITRGRLILGRMSA
jgi:BirA family transcriptional regulator, biotin operon repressor / biotin---[acetyl-CoA-carboxylase] ligase